MSTATAAAAVAWNSVHKTNSSCLARRGQRAVYKVTVKNAPIQNRTTTITVGTALRTHARTHDNSAHCLHSHTVLTMLILAPLQLLTPKTVDFSGTWPDLWLRTVGDKTKTVTLCVVL